MKLSEKGIETIFSALLKTIEERDLVFRRISQGVFKKHIEVLEFEPDDFEMVTTPNSEKIKGLDVKTKDLPTTPKEVHLTVEEANLLFKVIDGFFDMRLPTTKEIVALNKLKVRVERIAKAEKCDEVH